MFEVMLHSKQVAGSPSSRGRNSCKREMQHVTRFKFKATQEASCSEPFSRRRSSCKRVLHQAAKKYHMQRHTTLQCCLFTGLHSLKLEAHACITHLHAVGKKADRSVAFGAEHAHLCAEPVGRQGSMTQSLSQHNAYDVLLQPSSG
jgi:hypothetical protein